MVLARQAATTQDEVAASLQPCGAPGTTDVQAPFEAQGRGFVHGHGKGHSIIGPTLAWLRKQDLRNLRAASERLRGELLSTAATVQYEAANEVARQLGLADVALEPFTVRQQRQSRMDGGEEEDGSQREAVALGPPVVQPHIERERDRATAENRLPELGPAAFRNLPLTGAFQSTFPPYRLRDSFDGLDGACQPAYPARQLDTAALRSNAELFTVREDGVVEGVLKPDGSAATAVDKAADAQAWAASFSQDFVLQPVQQPRARLHRDVRQVRQEKARGERKLALDQNPVVSLLVLPHRTGAHGRSLQAGPSTRQAPRGRAFCRQHG